MNNSLTEAKRKKNDEYYTKYEDVENELKHYKDYLKGKVVYCPCDSDDSAFVKYLKDHLDDFQLKAVVNTSYEDGYDFREQTGLRDAADVIITNPPFSLFRDFMDWVGEKDCIILGPINALTYKNIFPKIKDSKLKLGVNFHKNFIFDRPDGSEKSIATGWYTTFPVRRVKPLELKTKAENEVAGVVYKKFDNYDAINVNRTKDIPSDYDGLMGVPITFLDKWDPNKFELIDCIGRYSVMHNEETRKAKKYLTEVNGKRVFSRLIIRRK